MVENIQGLTGFPGYTTPAVDQAQATREAEKTNPYLRRTQDENSGVTVTISKEAMALLRGSQQDGKDPGSQTKQANGGGSGDGESAAQLSDEQKQEVEQLKAGEQRVRAHEQAHLAVAGNLAKGGANYEYQTGPDGKRYVVGGEVSISMRDGKTPAETVQIAQQVQRAALAPADPSPQDRQVAADAAAKMSAAQAEASQQKQEEMTGGDKPTEGIAKTGGTGEAASTPTIQQNRPSGELAAVAMRGRQAFIRQGGMESSSSLGIPYSSVSFQA